MEDQRTRRSFDVALTVITRQRDVPVNDSLLDRIPGIGGLSLIGRGVAAHDVVIAQKPAVQNPLKAMLVGDGAPSERPLPTAACEKSEWLQLIGPACGLSGQRVWR